MKRKQESNKIELEKVKRQRMQREKEREVPICLLKVLFVFFFEMKFLSIDFTYFYNFFHQTSVNFSYKTCLNHTLLIKSFARFKYNYK